MEDPTGNRRDATLMAMAYAEALKLHPKASVSRLMEVAKQIYTRNEASK